MKKYVIALVLVFSLSGCGEVAKDYLDPKTYTDYMYGELNKLNKDYLPLSQKYLAELGLPNAGKEFTKILNKEIEKDLEGKTEREAKLYYVQFKKAVDKETNKSLEAKLNIGIEKMNSALADDELMKQSKKVIADAKVFFKESSDKIEKYVRGLIEQSPTGN